MACWAITIVINVQNSPISRDSNIQSRIICDGHFTLWLYHLSAFNDHITVGATPLEFRDDTEYKTSKFRVVFGLFDPEKFQFMKEAEFTIEIFEPLVEIRQVDPHSDRLRQGDVRSRSELDVRDRARGPHERAQHQGAARARARRLELDQRAPVRSRPARGLRRLARSG